MAPPATVTGSALELIAEKPWPVVLKVAISIGADVLLVTATCEVVAWPTTVVPNVTLVVDATSAAVPGAPAAFVNSCASPHPTSRRSAIENRKKTG